MWHHHNHWTNKSSDNIALAFFLNSFFVIVEIVGWLYTNSMSIVSDALHDLWDSLGLALARLAARYWDKHPNNFHTYGYKWYSLLSALILGIILMGWSLTIIYHSVIRLLNPEPIYSIGVIWLAVFGIIINGIWAYRTHTGQTQNEKIISWHLIEDVLGRVAVLIWGIIVYFTGLTFVDPLIAIFYSWYILYQGFKNLSETIQLLTQWTPSSINITNLKKDIKAISWIIEIHDTHCRSLDGENNIFTAHISTDWKQDIINLKKSIKELLEDKYHIHHTTLEFEEANEECEGWCN